MFQIYLSTAGLITLIILGVILLVGICLLLYFTVFAHKRLIKAADELSSIFETEHALFFGQDNQYLRRLESISNTNLVYVDEYTAWKKEFSTIRDTLDSSAQANVNSLRDMKSQRRYKELKNYLPIAKENIEAYKNAVDSFDSSLRRKFEEEENIKSSIVKSKEDYRAMKASYLSQQGNLTLVAESFDILFKKVDSLFEDIDHEIDSARYSEAAEILDHSIEPVVKQCLNVLKNLPEICLTITSLIPDKIAALNNRYDEMIKEGYPLNHLLFKGDIENLEIRLKALSEAVMALRLNGVEENLDNMITVIEGYFSSFEKEIAARREFETNSLSVYQMQNDLENDFILLNHSLPKVAKVYLITPDDQAEFQNIKIAIDKSSKAKRSLDGYVHSGTKQAYTTLLEILNSLKEENNQATLLVRSFQDKLTHMRDLANEAASAIHDYAFRFESAERDLRNFALPLISNQALPILENLYAQIDDLYHLLHTSPINIIETERRLSEFKQKADKFLSDVNITKNNLKEAENSYVFANRFRTDNADIDQALSQSENFFYTGHFKESLECSKEASLRASSQREILR